MTDKMPPEIREKILDGYRSGILLSVDRQIRKVTGIVWTRSMHPEHPADLNPLAEAIIKHVSTEDMPLELDGQHYLIRQADELGLR